MSDDAVKSCEFEIMVTKAAAARRLDIDGRTLLKWIERGRLRSRVTASGRRMVPMSDVLAIIEQAAKS